jgi:ubiquinone/menaquinone biosynthesis C-methylase UbiE
MATTEHGADPGQNDTSLNRAFVEAEAGQVWQRGAAVRRQAFGTATELMLDLAGLAPGSRVLDVAAGTGEQTLAAARRVGPVGQVLATDISASMLTTATQEAKKAGLANVETRVMDAQHLDLESESFDATISQMGVMLVPDHRAALAEMHRVLKPGGKLAVIVWSTPERNLYVLLPSLIARRHANLTPLASGQEGMFSLGSPGLLERVLTEAGFQDVMVQAVPAPRRFPSVPALIEFLIGSSPLLREPLTLLDEGSKVAMLAEIEHTMRQFDGKDGVEIPGEILVGAGIK